jgi:hypothetical protein
MLIAADTTLDERAFAARTTTLQFRAMKARLRPGMVVSEMDCLPHRLALRRASNCSEQEVLRWLTNGWNTEYLLQLNASALQNDALRHALHWAFPQAYYSVFAVTLAYFKAVGFTQDSHAGVIRKVGEEMHAGRYPQTMSCLGLGGKTRAYGNLSPGALVSPFHFDAHDAGVVDTHLSRFLNATRSQDLRARVKTMNFKTAGGKKKKRFTPTEWDRASARLGPTSILSLLYRKRIKANYQDIDTFLHPELDAGRVFNALSRSVGAMNFVHEAFIARAIGIPLYESWCGRLSAPARPIVARRLTAIRDLRQ